MAKEKTDATSLFSAMNKNRVKMTNKVKSSKNENSNDSSAQNSQNEGKSVIESASEKETKTKKKDISTKLVNEIFDNTNNITSDINSGEQQISVNVNENDPEKGEETVVPEYIEDDDNDAIAASAGSDNRRGRQDKELQHIHIALPRDVFDKLEIAKKAYYNNKTTYIRNLILNDYEKNKDYYDKLPNIR